MTHPEHTCVYGLSWGDEGKGKIVDLLCPQFDVVVRFNGGANAGHTVCVGDKKFALHLLPAGALHDDATAVIGPGVVVDPNQLISELDALSQEGIEAGERLKISGRAHLVLAYHKLEDQLSEQAASSQTRIGTTSRGIGPCYADKMKRSAAVRFIDLLQDDHIEERVARIVETKATMFRTLYGEDGNLSIESVLQDLRAAKQRLSPMIADTTTLLRQRIDSGAKLLFEGANGMLLDVDHGTYPFVTSSSTGPYGIGAGAGVPANLVTRLLGVSKAYATRVGAGPFVSELKDDTGDRIRQRGNEFGTTTGRPRRCGWFDAVAARYCVQLSGSTEMALMHLDTLSEFEQVGLCVAYACEGQPTDTFPPDARWLNCAQPVIEYLPGWTGDLRGCSAFEDLPETARSYVKRIETLTGVPVGIVSVGPDRSQTIIRDSVTAAT